MEITKVKKRDGSIVDYDRSRIEKAIENACVATGAAVEPNVFSAITDDVDQVLDRKFTERIPGVEDIQDVVEMTLADRGLFEVAKAYIIYRRQHADIRAHEREELLERIERREISVVKRNGESVEFNVGEIERAITNCCRDFTETIDVVGIIRDTKLSLYDGMPTAQINQAVVMAMRARIERDPAYSSLAARFLINDLYKAVVGLDEFNDAFANRHRDAFSEKIRAGVEAGRLDPRLL
ncbi:MAG: hypothetical protein KAJ37_05930, partial [Candidatus Krumholzibacteria bacterium]|nr:hypothetical protein [Candidatus Krumholzibacteria bacterium]